MFSTNHTRDATAKPCNRRWRVLLARYTRKVSNGATGGSAIEGQGYTWREAFDDTRPH